jgi:hypothetical protein
MRWALAVLLLATASCQKAQVAHGPSIDQLLSKCEQEGAAADPGAHGVPSMVNSDYLTTCMRASGFVFSTDALLCAGKRRQYLTDYDNPWCYERADPNSS